MPTIPGNAVRGFRKVSETDRLTSTLTEIYARQRATGSWNDYLESHSVERCVVGQVRTFQWYRPFLPKTGTVLDWGCQHAPDSCLLKTAFGNQFERHACDVLSPGHYEAFTEYADFHYRQLDHIVRIPYSNMTFDVVIASGVLEHVPMDYESLKEIHRILKPGGLLIGTYLPNRWSIAEWKRRVILRRNYHQRRYSRRDADQLLRHTGFIPERIEIQHFRGDRLIRPLGMLVPVHLLASTWCFVARSAHCM